MLTNEQLRSEKRSKPRPDLFPPAVRSAVGRVLGQAMEKHGHPDDSARNPEHPNGTREAHIASVERHWLAYLSGEVADPDDGEHPLVHAIARMAFLAERDETCRLQKDEYADPK